MPAMRNRWPRAIGLRGIERARPLKGQGADEGIPPLSPAMLLDPRALADSRIGEEVMCRSQCQVADRLCSDRATNGLRVRFGPIRLPAASPISAGSDAFSTAHVNPREDTG
jgi:hypothetical protein